MNSGKWLLVKIYKFCGFSKESNFRYFLQIENDRSERRANSETIGVQNGNKKTITLTYRFFIRFPLKKGCICS